MKPILYNAPQAMERIALGIIKAEPLVLDNHISTGDSVCLVPIPANRQIDVRLSVT